MNIQLVDHHGHVLYELEQSELFPDFRSVLREAIAYKINLKDLNIESENIDGVMWRGVNLDSISMKDCSMKKSEFIECTGKWLQLNSCDLSHSKFKKTINNEMHISDCNLSFCSFRDVVSEGSFVIGCDLSKSVFYGCNLKGTRFHTCNLSDVFFHKCSLDSTGFIHLYPGSEWIKNATFVSCSLIECDMKYVEDISTLYFWDTDLRGIKFKKEERITEISNDNSKIVYAIDSDVVWWKPYSWNGDDKSIFRGNLKEFTVEVESWFPTTDLYPEMTDYEIEEELSLVCIYLASWKMKIRPK